METIQDIVDAKLWLIVRCGSCGNRNDIPFRLIHQKIDRCDQIEDAGRHFKCSKCDSRDVKTSWEDIRIYRGSAA